MSLSTILNLFSCRVFADEELVGVYEDICERLVLHGDDIAVEDENILLRLIEKVTAIMNAKPSAVEVESFDNPRPGTFNTLVDPQPSTSRVLSPDNLVGQGLKGDQFKHFELIGEGEKKIKKFKTTVKSLIFKFNDTPVASNPMIWLANAFIEILNHLLADAAPSDRVGMLLRNDNYPEKPIGISFRRKDQINSAVILAALERILQSNANDSLRLQLDHAAVLIGYGRARQRLTVVSFKEFCRRKQGILVVENTDTLCLVRALVLALTWKRNDTTLPVLKNSLYLECTTRAASLCADANVDLSNGGTREHIQQFQDYLTDYTIVVYNNRRGQTVYYEGPRPADRQVLNLLFEDNHCNVITILTLAFATHYFCELCRIRFTHKTEHKSCKYICPCCHNSPPKLKLSLTAINVAAISEVKNVLQKIFM